MEEISKIAKAYYQTSPKNVQKLALEFFLEIDADSDGNVQFKEFSEFAKTRSIEISYAFFKQLDKDGNGTLDFWEVMTLYYIVKSGRPFCNHCEKFITSTYFTCVGCLENRTGKPFYLCVDCYSSQKFVHVHNNELHFVDNFLLLEALDKSKSKEVFRSPETSSRAVAVVDKPSSSYSARSPYTSTVIHPRKNTWEMALATVNTAAKVGAAAYTISTGLNLCSIL